MLGIKKRLKLGLIAVCAIGFLAGCGDELAYLNEKEFTKEEFKAKGQAFIDRVQADCGAALQRGVALKGLVQKNCQIAMWL